MRHKYFTEARNSLFEAIGAVIRDDDAEAIQALGLRVRRMLTALMR